MSIEIREAVRKTTCRGCNRTIQVGEPMLVAGNYQSIAYLCTKCIQLVVDANDERLGIQEEP